MKRPKIKPSYQRRCSNYLQWLPLQDDQTLNLFRVDHSLPDSADGDFTAVEAMLIYESQGEQVSCGQPYLLDCLKKGKTSREFHIKAFLSSTRAGEAYPEEFFGCLGLRSFEEFRSVFGVSLTLPRLRIIHQLRGHALGL